MKRCSNCFQIKPLDAFYRKLERHQARCKECNAEVCRPYRRAAYRAKVLGIPRKTALVQVREEFEE